MKKHDRQIMKIHLVPIPKQSISGIFTHISNENKPNVGKSAVHGEILESPFPYGKTPWKCNRASRGVFYRSSVDSSLTSFRSTSLKVTELT